MIDFGAGVRLRRIEPTDLPKLMAWRNSYAVRKWTRQWDLISQADQAQWFERQATDPIQRMYAIEMGEGTEPSRLVGVCGLTSIDLINRRAEFSLYIGSEYRRGGLGRLALSTLLAHGFKNMGLNCIWGESFDGNPAMRLFEELGFQKEGIRRSFYFRDGKFIDAHLYSLLASEWKPCLSLVPSQAS